MRRQSLLFVDQYAAFGGGQTVLLTLISVALEMGLAVTVLFPHGGELERRIKERFGDIVATADLNEPKLAHGRKGIGDALKLAWYAIRFLRFLPLFSRHEAVYLNGPRLYLPALILSFLLRRKSIYHVHLNHGGVERLALKLVVKSACTSKLVINSEFVYGELKRDDEIFARSEKIVVVANALPESLSKKEFHDRFAVDAPARVGIIGRVSPEKGHDVILRLAPFFPHLLFYVIGSADFDAGGFYERLKKSAPANVIFFGKVDDVPETVERLALQFSIVPSLWQEPFGLVAIESMALSCLTITSGTGELKNISELTGAFTYQSEADLQRLLAALCERPPADLAALARSQYERAWALYGAGRYADGIRGVLTEVFSAAPRKSGQAAQESL